MYLVKEAAKISGVSVRTLHHYDRIGLLVPDKSANGYRSYSEENLDTLQQICFYKYLGFALRDIQRLLNQKPRDNLAILQSQLMMLHREKARLATLIATLEQSIAALQGETTMTAQEKFAGFTYDDYLKHAAEKYDCCLEDVLAKQRGQEDEMMRQFNQIFHQFDEQRRQALAPADILPQQTADRFYQFLCDYSYDCDCTLQMYAEMAELYLSDTAFHSGIEQFGNGTAQFARDAIVHYVQMHG